MYIVLLLLLTSSIFAQSSQDIIKLKSEYEKMSRDKLINQNNTLNTDINLDSPGRVDIFPLDLDDQIDSVEKDQMINYFGYDFFTRRDTVSFWENLPAPSNYLLGPGDEIVIYVWGETKFRQTYTITREGKIYDDKVGLMTLSGKTIEDASDYLYKQYSRVYSTLKGNSPSSYMDISLGTLKSINVNFVGEVKYPGVYPVHPFSTVITGLIQAGGVKTTGSLRSLEIKRDGIILETVDLYEYLIKGSLPKNIQLRDQDIIVVPVRLSTITVDSAVVRPGIYESINGETIKDLLYYAGGLNHDASTRIDLKRILPFSGRKINQVNIENSYIDYSDAYLANVYDGDIITINKIFDSLREVEIIGQVKSPGKYNYFEGMKLNDLLNLGGGYGDSTFWKSVYQKRGEVIRRDPLTRYEKVIEIDLSNLDDLDGRWNIELQNLDRFIIHANSNFFEKKSIQIIGEINIPGSYPLIKDNETLESIINRAGSFTNKALKNGISIYRDNKYFNFDKSEFEEKSKESFQVRNNSIQDISNKVRVAWKNMSITLMPGDSIIVREATKTVNISGAVYNPGVIEFYPGKSLRYYLNAAGGLTENANKTGIIIVYANGVVSPKKWFISPKVEDGSTIIVNAAEDKEPFNITQFVTNWTSIISSMITAVILSKQLSSN
tara:strand:+ start:8871 stop:10862 length:1992 start_codon:yes stop_codon:yes gene_type:complete